VDSDEPESYVLQCHDDVNNHLRQINEALSLISIMGPTRSGKSTLLNLLAGCTTEPLFSTSPGAESWTRGNARTGPGLTPAPYTC
jgi:ABC-type phosphate/phosphonate transport system ATPase subunit